jgi:hypothetical protein
MARTTTGFPDDDAFRDMLKAQQQIAAAFQTSGIKEMLEQQAKAVAHFNETMRPVLEAQSRAVAGFKLPDIGAAQEIQRFIESQNRLAASLNLESIEALTRSAALAAAPLLGEQRRIQELLRGTGLAAYQAAVAKTVTEGEKELSEDDESLPDVDLTQEQAEGLLLWIHFFVAFLLFTFACAKLKVSPEVENGVNMLLTLAMILTRRLGK